MTRRIRRPPSMLADAVPEKQRPGQRERAKCLIFLVPNREIEPRTHGFQGDLARKSGGSDTQPSKTINRLAAAKRTCPQLIPYRSARKMPENQSLPPLQFSSLPQFCARTNATLRGHAVLAGGRAGARHYPVTMAKIPRHCEQATASPTVAAVQSHRNRLRSTARRPLFAQSSEWLDWQQAPASSAQASRCNRWRVCPQHRGDGWTDSAGQVNSLSAIGGRWS